LVQRLLRVLTVVEPSVHLARSEIARHHERTAWLEEQPPNPGIDLEHPRQIVDQDARRLRCALGPLLAESLPYVADPLLLRETDHPLLGRPLLAARRLYRRFLRIVPAAEEVRDVERLVERFEVILFRPRLGRRRGPRTQEVVDRE